jgi:hypothetical protein
MAVGLMKAARFYGVNVPLQIEHIPIPDIDDDKDVNVDIQQLTKRAETSYI